MTACLLMFNSFAALSNSSSMAKEKSTFTRWIGSIIRPEFVKKREMSLPRSAKRAMDSAGAGLGFLRVFVIKIPLFESRFPESDQMVVFACFVLPDFKNRGIQAQADPTDRPILTGEIGKMIQVVGMRENFLSFFESDSSLLLALPGVILEPHTGITLIP